MLLNAQHDDIGIGSGRLGIVFKAELVVEATETETVVAVKRLRKPRYPEATDNFLSVVEEKANRWSTLSHPNVLSITGYSVTEEDTAVDVLLVFPYTPTGTITDYIKQRSPNHSQRMKLAADVAQGLFYLHTRTPPIRHGNLHPRNVLMKANGDAVLCDYDTDELASQVEEHPVVDSFRYLSPEHLTANTELSLRSDIWCLGSVFLCIITDQIPYQHIIDRPALVEVLSQRVLPADIDRLPCPPRAQNVIGLCWKWELESRPNLSEIISVLSGKICKFTEAWSVSVNKSLDCLRFSNDGKFLVVGFSKFGFRVYDAENGALAYELPLPGSSYLWVQTSRSGRFLVASNDDHKILLCDLETRTLKSTFKGHNDNIWALDMPTDDSYVMSGSDDTAIRIWRPAPPKDNSKLLKKTKEIVSCLVISPIADVAAISVYEYRNELIDANTGQTIAVLERPDHTRTLRFSPDGKRVYGGCRNGRVLGQVPSLPYHEIKGAKLLQSAVTSVSASNSWLVSISSDGDVRAMKLESRTISTESIGKISQYLYTNRADLSPVSDDGVGFAVACPENSELLTVYRYMSWDVPGVYMY
ncbi:hypothetical protein FRB99_005824 [Tulasnella sp. 403]|nr:hypothetical protein FRB99_005824 [Tulasnella sp. 403]